LRYYTTSIAMADLDAVRVALGYDKINLYGVSYGTRAALTYLQQYPGRVRAIILDGVVPQDWDIGLHFAPDGQRALDLIFDRCAADPACQAAFPNVRAEFDDLLASLAEQPAQLVVAHPTTHQSTEVTLTRDLAASTIRLLTYSPETAGLIPVLVHAAQAENDYRPLAAQFLVGNANLAATMSDGMTNSVVCSEDVRFDAELAAAGNTGSYVGNSATDWLLDVCAAWPKGDLPPGFKSPVVSDVPALLLSGDADPVTPPSNADHAAQTLPNSLHIVLEGQGHNIIFRGCIPRIAADFIERGSVTGLDPACAADIRPVAFFVSFTGPSP
jgi:pimeloyl-ACP methyl ester carboxylesterase